MPCRIWLRADDTSIYCNDPADVVAERVERAGSARFITVELTPQALGHGTRTGYISPDEIAAILPMDPRELAHELENDPPDWLTPSE